MHVVKTVTMYKEERCSRCGFKMAKGDKAYDIGEGKIVCSVCYIMLKKGRKEGNPLMFREGSGLLYI